MKVIFLPGALADLDAIRAGSAAFSERGAAVLVGRILARAAQLETVPNSGRVEPELGLPAFRELIEDDCRILHHVLADRVEVLAVLHGRRSFP